MRVLKNTQGRKYFNHYFASLVFSPLKTHNRPMNSNETTRLYVETAVSSVLGIVLFVAFWLALCDFSRLSDIRPFADASFIDAAVMLAFVGLRFATRQGTFDILGYAGYALFLSFKPQPTERKYRTAGDYKIGMRERRKERKAHFVPWLINAGVYLLVAIVLTVVWNVL